jgi:hypothetical protein
MLADRLGKAWRAHRGETSIDPVMRFSDQGLVLGAGTVLAPARGPSRDISIDPLEPRLQALLAAAHLRRPAAGALAHLRKAAERWNEGEGALASMHLALSRLDRLQQPEADAHRLFLADGLLKNGVPADAIVDAIEAGAPDFEGLRKYNPDQPRVPAGSGRPSGEWTTGGGGSPVNSPSGAGAGARSAVAPAPASAPAKVPEAKPPTTQPPQPEVNPSTITPAVLTTSDSSPGGPQAQVNPSTITAAGTASIHACTIARLDCVNAAFAASDYPDAPNDNFPTEDIKNCREADTACDLLSMAVEDVPFLDYGGVIFPHRGVVIMQKGRLDVYFPPPSPGLFPRIRRMI